MSNSRRGVKDYVKRLKSYYRRGRIIPIIVLKQD